MAESVATNNHLEAIRLALQTEIIDVFRQRIDVLRPMTREQAYEMVLNQPMILSNCLDILRTHPEYFEHLILGPDGNPVDFANNYDVMLKCGRTLNEIIGIVLRSATKRYFRRTVGIRGSDGGSKLNRKRADDLYTAISDHILYEWQTTLIPSYARLNIGIVTLLNERILEFRDPAELIGLAENPPPLSSPLPPLLLDTADRVFNPRSGSLNPETMWRVFQQMDIARLYPGHDSKSLLTVISQVVLAQPEALDVVRPVLGTSLRRFCLFLFTVHSELGNARYQSVFGRGGQWYVVERWMARYKERPEPALKFDDMLLAYRNIVTAGTQPEFEIKKPAAALTR